MRVIVAEEFFILFIAHAVIHQYAVVAVFYQQAAHGPGTHIVLIGRVYFVPHALGHYAKHGATIKLKVPGVY